MVQEREEGSGEKKRYVQEFHSVSFKGAAEVGSLEGRDRHTV